MPLQAGTDFLEQTKNSLTLNTQNSNLRQRREAYFVPTYGRDFYIANYRVS